MTSVNGHQIGEKTCKRSTSLSSQQERPLGMKGVLILCQRFSWVDVISRLIAPWRQKNICHSVPWHHPSCQLSPLNEFSWPGWRVTKLIFSTLTMLTLSVATTPKPWSWMALISVWQLAWQQAPPSQMSIGKTQHIVMFWGNELTCWWNIWHVNNTQLIHSHSLLVLFQARQTAFQVSVLASVHASILPAWAGPRGQPEIQE